MILKQGFSIWFLSTQIKMKSGVLHYEPFKRIYYNLVVTYIRVKVLLTPFITNVRRSISFATTFLLIMPHFPNTYTLFLLLSVLLLKYQLPFSIIFTFWKYLLIKIKFLSNEQLISAF